MAYSLVGFAELVGLAALQIEDQKEALEKAAVMLEKEVHNVVGSLALTPNAAATIERKGFDLPGIETSEMVQSITHNSDHKEAYVGSDNKKLLWLEFGSKKKGNAWGADNPPRPALGITVARKGGEAAEIVGHAVMTAIAVTL